MGIALSAALTVLACAPAPAPRSTAPAPVEVHEAVAIDPGATMALDLGTTVAAVPEPVAADGPIGPAAASWYGPGMWGNRTACGHTLTAELVGVAHRTLPCGWLVVLRYGSSTVTVPVVDRGPFNYGREFDLTYAAKIALACPDLCRLEWVR